MFITGIAHKKGKKRIIILSCPSFVWVRPHMYELFASACGLFPLQKRHVLYDKTEGHCTSWEIERRL